MDWGTLGVINNHVESQRVVVMATKNNTDNVWEEIFDSLILTSEPPQKYIKKVIITTTNGDIIGMSAQEFSAVLEQEKRLPPGTSDIQSARMSLDFNKIKKDVDKWANDVLIGFDTQGKPRLPKFPKPKAGVPKVIKPKVIKPKVIKTTVSEPKLKSKPAK